MFFDEDAVHTTMARLVRLLLLLVCLTSVLFGDETTGKLNPQSIENVFRYSKANRGIELIVWQEGEVLFDQSYNGHKSSIPIHIYSCELAPIGAGGETPGKVGFYGYVFIIFVLFHSR